MLTTLRRPVSLAPFYHFARTAACAIAALVALGATSVWAPVRAAESAQVAYPGVERVIAFADVHGAYDDLTRLLKAAGVVDAELRWSGGRTRGQHLLNGSIAARTLEREDS